MCVLLLCVEDFPASQSNNPTAQSRLAATVCLHNCIVLWLLNLRLDLRGPYEGSETIFLHGARLGDAAQVQLERVRLQLEEPLLLFSAL
jgi:hypothetical protein